MHINISANASTGIDYVHVVLTATNCTLLFFTLFIGIAANLFVAWAVRNQKSLQTSNNALLVNLAVIDFLRCVIDCPFILEVFLNGDRIGKIGSLLCDVQFVSFSITCCVQLLTLASISAERYQAIAHPFKTAERRKRVTVWIPLTWTVAVAVSVMCLRFAIAKDSLVYARCKGLDVEELPSYDAFGVYVLVPLWTACLAVIIGFYTRIFLLVKAHNRKIFDKGTVFNPNDKSHQAKAVKKDSTTIKEIITVPEVAQQERAAAVDDKVSGNNDIPESVCAADQELTENKQHADASRAVDDNIISGQSKKANAVVVIDLEKRDSGELQPAPVSDEPATLKPDSELQPENKSTVPASLKAESEIPSEGKSTITIPAEPANQDDVAGAVCMMPPRDNLPDRAKKSKEGKLAKRSGYIILTFLILWTPFILAVLVNFLMRRAINTHVSRLQASTHGFIKRLCRSSVINL